MALGGAGPRLQFRGLGLSAFGVDFTGREGKLTAQWHVVVPPTRIAWALVVRIVVVIVGLSKRGQAARLKGEEWDGVLIHQGTMAAFNS